MKATSSHPSIVHDKVISNVIIAIFLTSLLSILIYLRRNSRNYKCKINSCLTWPSRLYSLPRFENRSFTNKRFYGAPIMSLFYVLNICSIYVEYSFYVSNIFSVFQMFVPYFKYVFYISNIYFQFEIFVQYPKNLRYISNIYSVLKWFYSLPSLFCTSISVLCFKYSFCISNIHSNCFFTDEEIVKVTSCKSLKNGKAMDPEGYINELFNSCGYDLRNSLKLLCNKIKSQKAVPSNWENISITTIFKRKGSKKN